MKFSFFTFITLLSVASYAQNVGIGETSPANKLSVKGSVSVGAGYSTTAAPTNGAIIQGNVGIGTSSPANPLEVAGTTKTTNIQVTNLAGLGKVLVSDASGNGVWTSAAAVLAAFGTGTQNYLTKWNNAGGTTIGNSQVYDNGTNVGIGTTSPNSKLAIVGRVIIGDNSLTNNDANDNLYLERVGSYTQMHLFNNDGSNPDINAYISENTTANGSGFGNNNPGLNIWTASAHPIRLATNATERLTILSGGNVGINNTSPASTLDIAGTTKTTNLQMTSGAAANSIMTSDASGNGSWNTGSGLFIQNQSASVQTANFNISGNGYIAGNLGIGTTSPAAALDVSAGLFHTTYNTQSVPGSYGTGGLSVSWNRTGGSAEVNFYNVFNNATTAFQFSQKTGASTYTDLMTMAGNGNIGIGNTSPNNKLEITGATSASGLRFTNLTQTTTPTTSYSKGKYLSVNSSGDVISSSPIQAESRYMVCVRRLNTNGNATWSTVFTSTDEYGLPYPASGVITYTSGSPYSPSIKNFIGSGGYLNPYYDAVDNDAYLGGGTSYVLIYDFYIVFPSTGTYTFSLPSTVDDVAAFYTTPLNDLNPVDMVQRTLVSQYSSPASPSNYAVTATAGDAVRARVYYAQGGGGASLSLNVSGASTTLMNMVYSIK